LAAARVAFSVDELVAGRPWERLTTAALAFIEVTTV
jgi:hypothetical protein